MHYSIGYQLPDELDSTIDIVRDYRDSVAEVYFAWPGESSGRTPVGMEQLGNLDHVKEVMGEELRQIRGEGVRLVMLMNANCYGGEAISRKFQTHIREQVEMMRTQIGVDAVTTTSPFVAEQIRACDSDLEIRASVNMRIGTVKGMAYLADLFDGYYMQREYNRDFDTIQKLYGWCQDHDKKLHLLANSGCLNFCSSQIYHDNLVAHEKDIAANENVKRAYPSPCWEFMQEPKNWVSFLQNSWIRPEDIHHYEKYFDTAKLATRMHANPRKVIAAYARKRFRGNLPDLLEPGHSSIFQGFFWDNQKFPEDWFDITSKCSKQCHECQYCMQVFKKVLTPIQILEDQYLQ